MESKGFLVWVDLEISYILLILFKFHFVTHTNVTACGWFASKHTYGANCCVSSSKSSCTSSLKACNSHHKTGFTKIIWISSVKSVYCYAMMLKWCYIFVSLMLCCLVAAINGKSTAGHVFTSSFLVKFKRNVDNQQAHEIAERNGFINLGAVSSHRNSRYIIYFEEYWDMTIWWVNEIFFSQTDGQ